MTSGQNEPRNAGFSLIELLVAMAVLAIIGVVMVSVTGAVQKISRQTKGQVEQFRESRRAFDRINQRLSQATLNTYYDYVDTNGVPRTSTAAASFTPFKYSRISELRYLQTNANASGFTSAIGGTNMGQAVFFQAPLGKTDTNTLSGLNSLLNTVGYFIVKGDDANFRPPTVTATKNRYRLFEVVQPTEILSIYALTSGNATNTSTTWATDVLANSNNFHRLADNVVALVFQAMYPTNATNPSAAWQVTNNYSSAPRNAATQAPEENNLPPRVKVDMSAVDEPSAQRIQDMGITLTNALNGSGLVGLEAQLISNNLNFRRFQSVVTIGPAKWSTK